MAYPRATIAAMEQPPDSAVEAFRGALAEERLLQYAPRRRASLRGHLGSPSSWICWCPTWSRGRTRCRPTCVCSPATGLAAAAVPRRVDGGTALDGGAQRAWRGDRLPPALLRRPRRVHRVERLPVRGRPAVHELDLGAAHSPRARGPRHPGPRPRRLDPRGAAAVVDLGAYEGVAAARRALELL